MRALVIDNFSLLLSHGLLLLVAWRLLSRADLNWEDPAPMETDPPPRFGARSRPGKRRDA